MLSYRKTFIHGVHFRYYNSLISVGQKLFRGNDPIMAVFVATKWTRNFQSGKKLAGLTYKMKEIF